MRISRLAPLLAAALGVCAAAPAPLTARDAIDKAAEWAPHGFAGEFEMQVRGAGRRKGYEYLNSEVDYHDQRNLTVDMDPAVVAAFAQRIGADPVDYFRGRRIVVRGRAQRVRVVVLADDGRPTPIFYYQTHIVVRFPEQVSVVG